MGVNLFLSQAFTWSGIGWASLETILMVVCSVILSYLIGLPVGILLNITSEKGLKPNKVINLIIGTIVNILRSIPCVLAIIILIPVTNGLFGRGSWTGNWYSMIVPLTFVSFGFVARMVEQSLDEIELGKVEAARSLGCSNWQIIYKVLLPEARSSLLSGFAVSTVSIIGYTSFAGYISAGGLIAYAFNLGYYGTDDLGMWLCVLFVIIIVQLIQELTIFLSRKIDRRKKG